MQVNDAVLAGDNTLVSCSSDTTLKVVNLIICVSFVVSASSLTVILWTDTVICSNTCGETPDVELFV